MRKEMEKADFKSVRGNFKFGNNHIPIQNYYLTNTVKEGDEFRAQDGGDRSSRTIRTASTTNAR